MERFVPLLACATATPAQSALPNLPQTSLVSEGGWEVKGVTVAQARRG